MTDTLIQVLLQYAQATKEAGELLELNSDDPVVVRIVAGHLLGMAKACQNRLGAASKEVKGG